MAERVSFDEALVAFVEALRKKGAQSIEIGYHPLDGSDDDPPQGEPVRWYASMRSRGRAYSGECIGSSKASVLIALKNCAEAAGLSVRLQFEEGR